MSKVSFKIRVAEPIITVEDIEAVTEALRKKCLSSGEYVEKFEKVFASYMGTKEAVAVNSGTAALHIILKAMEVGPGDEVITTPFTFASPANVTVLLGARPVFVDVETDTYNLDPGQIKPAITEKTRVIMPIHYGGQCAEMDEIMEIATKNNLYVVEDAAEAAGAKYKGKMAGSLGHAAGFSFYPDKNITTGEGGMITTNDTELAERARILRNHGATARYYHVDIGWNYRMIDFVAALGLTQLNRLEDVIKQKNIIAQRYTERLQELNSIHPPMVKAYNRHTFMLYSIRTDSLDNRERVRRELQMQGIETRINFPPVHLQPIYRRLFDYHPGAYPMTESIADAILGLPIHLKLTEQDQQFILEVIKESLRR